MKTFTLVYRVTLMFLFCVGLILKIFGPQIEKAFTYQRVRQAVAIAKTAERSISSRVEASPTHPGPEFSTKKTVIAQAITKEVAQVQLPDLRQEFRGKIMVQPCKRVTKVKESNRLTIGMYKWMMNHKWRGPVKGCIEKFGLPDTLYNALISMPVQESGVKPEIKNDSSSATGLYQLTAGTAKKLAEKYATEFGDLDPRLVNRKNPNENILLGVYYFRDNWIVSSGSLKMTILLHLTGGLSAARDTINAHGGIDNVPFVQRIVGIMNTPEEEPPAWAVQKCQNY
jgi:hypothetical protein